MKKFTIILGNNAINVIASKLSERKSFDDCFFELLREMNIPDGMYYPVMIEQIKPGKIRTDVCRFSVN